MNQIKKQVIREGDNYTYPKKGNLVRVHFEVKLLNGTLVDSTRQRKQSFELQIGIGQVIEGFQQALAKMTLGQKSMFQIPPQKAYGKEGIQGQIPGNQTLVFEIQLLSIR